jgi:hypothetical protein
VLVGNFFKLPVIGFFKRLVGNFFKLPVATCSQPQVSRKELLPKTVRAILFHRAHVQVL